MPRGFDGHGGFGRGFGHGGFGRGFGFDGLGFGGPFLGGLAGGLLGSALFPGYGYGGYPPYYGGYPYYPIHHTAIRIIHHTDITGHINIEKTHGNHLVVSMRFLHMLLLLVSYYAWIVFLCLFYDFCKIISYSQFSRFYTRYISGSAH